MVHFTVSSPASQPASGLDHKSLTRDFWSTRDNMRSRISSGRSRKWVGIMARMLVGELLDMARFADFTDLTDTGNEQLRLDLEALWSLLPKHTSVLGLSFRYGYGSRP